MGIGDVVRFRDTRRVSEALRLAGAEELVQRLPDGLDTVVMDSGGGSGIWGGGGAREISDGEWNRIELARALMRADDAKLILLDEPCRDFDGRFAFECNALTYYLKF